MSCRSNYPHAVAGYVTSANAHDAEACARYFTEDAVVRDEGQDRRGIAGYPRVEGRSEPEIPAGDEVSSMR